MHVAVEHRVALAERILLRQGDDADGRALGKPVFQIGDIGAQERKRLLRIQEIQGAVAQRQVEKLLLPDLPPFSWTRV